MTPAPIVTAAYIPAVAAPTLRQSVVATAQEILANLGYYGGAIDGAFGPKTNAAVLRYQKDYGLPVTGRLDPTTRQSLGL